MSCRQIHVSSSRLPVLGLCLLCVPVAGTVGGICRYATFLWGVRGASERFVLIQCALMPALGGPAVPACLANGGGGGGVAVGARWPRPGEAQHTLGAGRA